jgi:hypothetical protein
MGDINAMNEFLPELLSSTPEIRYPIEIAEFPVSKNSDALITRRKP